MSRKKKERRKKDKKNKERQRGWSSCSGLSMKTGGCEERNLRKNLGRKLLEKTQNPFSTRSGIEEETKFNVFNMG